MNEKPTQELTWQFEECYLILTSNKDGYDVKMVFRDPFTCVFINDEIKYMNSCFFAISFNPLDFEYKNGINKLSDLHRKLNGKSAQWIFKFLRDDELQEI